jgi:hypothetical protein
MTYYTEKELATLQTQAIIIADGLMSGIISARATQRNAPVYTDREAFEIGLEIILDKTADIEVYTYLYSQAIIHARHWFPPETVSMHKNRAWEAEVKLLEGIGYD